MIGVDKYTDPQISPLKGADNDARTLADALIRYAGFPQDQVILLSTDQPIERQPTRLNILRRLSKSCFTNTERRAASDLFRRSRHRARRSGVSGS